MTFSCIVDGNVLDFHYKKLGDKTKNFHYAFYIGNIYVGQLFRMGEGNWAAVGRDPHPLSPINGLRTRYHACELLLKMAGYWGKE